MYVSKIFTKAKKSVLCAEYPSNQNTHQNLIYPNGKQFIDRFFNIEEVVYLIH